MFFQYHSYIGVVVLYSVMYQLITVSSVAVHGVGNGLQLPGNHVRTMYRYMYMHACCMGLGFRVTVSTLSVFHVCVCTTCFSFMVSTHSSCAALSG